MKIVVLDGATLGGGIDLAPLEMAGELTFYELTAPEELSGRIADAEVIVSNKLNSDFEKQFSDTSQLQYLPKNSDAKYY